jgi:hypothetical protein|tara:strand:- start:180 stop:731 length:552 start_codon:yes stop_codon:yes gene_type:complete
MPIINKKIIILTIFSSFFLNACSSLPGGDARKNPPNPDERVKRNLEEGKGFRLDNALGGNKSTNFEFASSNELWRASLDTIDFMPLLSANYSGGIIITDWYSEEQEEAIKITLRFLSNEVRSDALDIKVFYKKCDVNMKCTVSEQQGNLKKELKKEILKKATIYKKQNKDKNFKPYNVTDLKD